MIPLNKPYLFDDKMSSQDVIKDHFPEYKMTCFYSSREGLNYVYKKLYAERGQLRVAVSPLTCFIALYPIILNGHIPVFVDINPQTLNIDVAKLCNTTQIDVVQVIHLGGNPVDMESVMSIAHQKGWIVIEDCAQALGSSINGKWVGGFGDYSVFSAVKNFHCWLGGMLLVSKQEVIDIPQCGISKTLELYKKIKIYIESKVSYKNNLLSFVYLKILQLKEKSSNENTSNIVRLLNDKLSDEICKKLHKFAELQVLREKNAKKIIDELDCADFHIQREFSLNVYSNRNRLIFVSEKRLAKDIILELRKRGIAANNMTQNYLNGYQEHIENDEILCRYSIEKLPIYESILPKVVAIPCSAALTNDEIEYIVKNVKEVII